MRLPILRTPDISASTTSMQLVPPLQLSASSLLSLLVGHSGHEVLHKSARSGFLHTYVLNNDLYRPEPSSKPSMQPL